MLKHQVQYHDIGGETYETKQPERELACLKTKAAEMGVDLSPRGIGQLKLKYFH